MQSCPYPISMRLTVPSFSPSFQSGLHRSICYVGSSLTDKGLGKSRPLVADKRSSAAGKLCRRSPPLQCTLPRTLVAMNEGGGVTRKTGIGAGKRYNEYLPSQSPLAVHDVGSRSLGQGWVGSARQGHVVMGEARGGWGGYPRGGGNRTFSAEQGVGQGGQRSGKWQVVTQSASQEGKDRPPVYVLMFVAMVGWGKNSVCESLMTGGSAGEGGQWLMSQLDMQGNAAVLEGDELKDGFWGAVDTAMQDPGVSLLILNRNFPPNSWSSSMRKLTASARGRKVVPIAMLPKSVGSASHAFSFKDLAVCLSSVQSRTGHGTNLDAGSDVTVQVTCMFYNFYRDQGGFERLADRVSKELTPRQFTVDWLKGDAETGPMPEVLEDALEHVLRGGQARQKAMEGDLRKLLRLEEYSGYLARCRMSRDEVMQNVLRGLKEAVKEAT